MPRSSKQPVLLSEMPTFDKETGALQVVIETPKDSRNKYDYDPECNCFELGKVLPEGMSFPYDFGFIPSTLGDDGSARHPDPDGRPDSARLPAAVSVSCSEISPSQISSRDEGSSPPIII